MKCAIKLHQILGFIILIFMFSGCSILFPTPERRLSKIEYQYNKLQSKLDKVLDSEFTNTDIDKIQDEYDELFEDIIDLKRDMLKKEEKGATFIVDRNKVVDYYDKIQRKVIICEDLKD